MFSFKVAQTNSAKIIRSAPQLLGIAQHLPASTWHILKTFWKHHRYHHHNHQHHNLSISLYFSRLFLAKPGKLRAEAAGEKRRKVKPDTVVYMAVCRPLSNYLELRQMLQATWTKSGIAILDYIFLNNNRIKKLFTPLTHWVKKQILRNCIVNWHAKNKSTYT